MAVLAEHRRGGSSCGSGLRKRDAALRVIIEHTPRQGGHLLKSVPSVPFCSVESLADVISSRLERATLAQLVAYKHLKEYDAEAVSV